jgi:hypothetical protein
VTGSPARGANGLFADNNNPKRASLRASYHTLPQRKKRDSPGRDTGLNLSPDWPVIEQKIAGKNCELLRSVTS